jgi:hypothetical protein
MLKHEEKKMKRRLLLMPASELHRRLGTNDFTNEMLTEAFPEGLDDDIDGIFFIDKEDSNKSFLLPKFFPEEDDEYIVVERKTH